MDQDLEIVRLAPVEVDDQAIAEIRALALQNSPGEEPIPIERLVGLAASGRMIVARRPCGMIPEIVGFAVMTAPAGDGASRRVSAVDPTIAGPDVEGCLRRALHAQQSRLFLFRPSRRAPLGLFHAVN
jgi:hypothetical protein